MALLREKIARNKSYLILLREKRTEIMLLLYIYIYYNHNFVLPIQQIIPLHKKKNSKLIRRPNRSKKFTKQLSKKIE